MKIIVEYRYDRWEVIEKYGYRETLLAVVANQAEGLKAKAEYEKYWALEELEDDDEELEDDDDVSIAGADSSAGSENNW